MTSNLALIVHAIPTTDYPKALVDALAFEDAVDVLLHAAKIGTPVDLNTATTPANAADVIDAAVLAELGHDVRIRHTEALAKIAAERANSAKMSAVIHHVEKFRAAYDAAADKLYALLKKHPVDPDLANHGSWNYDPALVELRAVLAELERLGAIRDNYAYLSGVVLNPPVSNVYEKLSRVAVFDDIPAAMAWNAKIGSAPVHSPKSYLWAAKLPGVMLKWQDSGEQHAQPAPARIARGNAALASRNLAREHAPAEG